MSSPLALRVISAAWLLLALTACTDAARLSRDLGCDTLPNEREQQICRRIEGELEWTWTGHAIIAPGWRPGFATARRVYCDLPIGPTDAQSLARMTRQAGGRMDWRLPSAAHSLLRLLGPVAVTELKRSGGEFESVIAQIEIDISAETSIFNPDHPGYVLRGGCARR